MYEIEKGVPISKGRRKYPWNEMEVGDSFVVPPFCNISPAAHAAGFKGCIRIRRFSCFVIKDEMGHRIGTRVQRVE